MELIVAEVVVGFGYVFSRENNNIENFEDKNKDKKYFNDYTGGWRKIIDKDKEINKKIIKNNNKDSNKEFAYI